MQKNLAAILNPSCPGEKRNMMKKLKLLKESLSSIHERVDERKIKLDKAHIENSRATSDPIKSIAMKL